jgi:hypothetical protein
MKKNSFESWDLQTKTSWLDQIRKDNPLFKDADQFRVIENQIEANAFAFVSDLSNEGIIQNSVSKNNQWKTGCHLKYDSFDQMKQALNLALENGAEYLHIESDMDPKQLNQLLENVYLEMITTRWTFSSGNIRELKNILFKSNPEAAIFITDNFKNDVSTDEDKNNTGLCQLDTFNSTQWSNSLYSFLKNPDSFKNKIKIIFEVQIDNQFLQNIAALRALRMIINKIWFLYQIKLPYYLELNISKEALHSNTHDNLYRLAAMGVTAAVSGVDYIVLQSADAHALQSDLQWLKTSLHTQHLLREESYLTAIPDPLAGSYFIEDLSEKIAKKIWSGLQELISND